MVKIRSHLACALAATVFVAAATTFSNAAPPKLEYFYPAGVQRGKTAEIMAGGAFDRWPVRVWADHPDVRVNALEKKGQLSVTVSDDAQGGICWLRLYDIEGATEIRPLLIGTLPETLEVEPNDAPDKAQALKQSMLVNGKLAERGDVDTFSIELEKGQMLVASMRANELLGSPMDGVLQVADHKGFVLAQNHDARGLDPLIAYEAPADGIYLVRAFAFPAKPNSTIDFAGGEDLVYRLTITTGPVLDHTMPLAVQRDGANQVALVGWNLTNGQRTHKIAAENTADGAFVDFAVNEISGMTQLPVVPHRVSTEQSGHSPASPQRIDIPHVVCGTLSADREVDAYRFSATKGQKLVLRVDSHTLGFPLDPVLEVMDASGKVLAKSDDLSRTDRDARLVFTGSADGEFDVRVRDLHGGGGKRFAYRLTIHPQSPSFQLTLAAGEFAVQSGKTIEIPVKIERENGYAQEIEVTAIDLPQNVSVTAVTSHNEGASAKEVKLKLTAAGGAASGPFRIVGRSPAADVRPTTASFSREGTTSFHELLWLTVQPP